MICVASFCRPEHMEVAIYEAALCKLAVIVMTLFSF